MQTLDMPLYELNQGSEYYKTIKEIKDSHSFINSIIDEIDKEHGFEKGDFVYYGSSDFGFYINSKSFEKFKDELKKHPDRNGVYRFKRSSKIWKAIHPKMKPIAEIHNKKNPFALHDIFGWNNLKATQWVGDRYFVGVRSTENIESSLGTEARKKMFEVEPVQHIDYKDYLGLIMVAYDKQQT